MYNDVATHNMLIYRIISCSLQLLVGTSGGADSKGQTSLGMYIVHKSNNTTTRKLNAYCVSRPFLPPVFDCLQ